MVLLGRQLRLMVGLRPQDLAALVQAHLGYNLGRVLRRARQVAWAQLPSQPQVLLPASG